jgi:putative transposase
VATKQTFETIDQARIVPHATHYTIEGIYEQPLPCADLAPQWIAGMDLGVYNVAVVTSNQPGFVPLQVNGRPLKALNQLYNKRRAQYQAVLSEEQHTSRRLEILTDTRKRQVESYLHVASRRIVEQLIHCRIGTLVIGKNGGWKQDVNLGKRSIEIFVFLPHARFIRMLAQKAQLVGIQDIMTEESYTSKCGSLDHEPLSHQERYVGKRLKRGLFQTATSRRLNADVNGAYNMILQVVPDAFGKGRAGVVVHPVRLSLTNRRLASYTTG